MLLVRPFTILNILSYGKNDAESDVVGDAQEQKCDCCEGDVSRHLDR